MNLWWKVTKRVESKQKKRKTKILTVLRPSICKVLCAAQSAWTFDFMSLFQDLCKSRGTRGIALGYNIFLAVNQKVMLFASAFSLPPECMHMLQSSPPTIPACRFRRSYQSNYQKLHSRGIFSCLSAEMIKRPAMKRKAVEVQNFRAEY